MVDKPQEHLLGGLIDELVRRLDFGYKPIIFRALFLRSVIIFSRFLVSKSFFRISVWSFIKVYLFVMSVFIDRFDRYGLYLILREVRSFTLVLELPVALTYRSLVPVRGLPDLGAKKGRCSQRIQSYQRKQTSPDADEVFFLSSSSIWVRTVSQSVSQSSRKSTVMMMAYGHCFCDFLCH